MAGAWVSTLVDWVTSCSASNISPKPIRMRPMRPTVVAWRAMKSTTPMKMNSGESQDRSRENTSAIRLVPMSAPSITAKADCNVIRPWPTKEATISAVAVLDCTRAVTPTPEAIAVRRLLILLDRTLRRLAPKTRTMPVRTSCVPQTSRAMAASRLSKWVTKLPSSSSCSC